jgi:hypothetical protein
MFRLSNYLIDPKVCCFASIVTLIIGLRNERIVKKIFTITEKKVE